MNIWKRIRGLSVSQLWKFGMLFLNRPLLAYPTYKATASSMKICYRLFGKMHHRRGKANAFRHALWNYKICQNCQKQLKSSEKSIKWAKKVTDLYEKVTKNDPLDREMDYHNNAFGRKLYAEIDSASEQKIIDLLLKSLKNSQKAIKVEDFEQNSGELVYLTEDPC